jgi:ribose 5-phosphate isomerase B
MNVAMGADEAGYQLKEIIRNFLETKGYAVKDFGVYNEDAVLYPDYAVSVAESILNGECERGVLICGTGIGMAITANKVPGIRAAVCHDVYSAERARKSNDAQIICLGARIVGSELAKMLLETWLKSDFAGGNSVRKVERIQYYDEKYKHII